MGIRQTIKTWGEYRSTVRELNRLDDRMLSDLGIERGNIAKIARDNARGN